MLGEKIDKKHFNNSDVLFTSKILKAHKKSLPFCGKLYKSIKKMN